MYKLQNLNVIKVVETKSARDYLLARGYVEITAPAPKPAPEPAPEPAPKQTARKKAEK
ncbi:MAG: hypothetical protein E6041_16370 [Escherichia coli]|uniref:hypothetical protein n=1 Tax=Negativicoccus succinicivorans TaxID=620903 RepID=UPI002912ACDC|nr:hypothetical protein [Negativicoccus succinicivorans]MDU5530351.1 hypothetical protein [Negativicoccus succinicivorans]MDU5564102.1 hypothetical protein [Streptococcus vestibularis]MDU5593395.1 hypothetical protein [Escherichia coli]